MGIFNLKIENLFLGEHPLDGFPRCAPPLQSKVNEIARFEGACLQPDDALRILGSKRPLPLQSQWPPIDRGLGLASTRWSAVSHKVASL